MITQLPKLQKILKQDFLEIICTILIERYTETQIEGRGRIKEQNTTEAELLRENNSRLE